MYVSFDIGGTSMRVARSLSVEEPVFLEDPKKINHTGHFFDDVNTLLDYTKSLIGDSPVLGVGVGVTGTVNKQGMFLESAHNLTHWVDQPIASLVEERLGASNIILENDTVTAGIGEVLYGTHMTDFDYIIWGTGIGGVRIGRDTDGRIVMDNLNETLKDRLMLWEADCGGASIARLFGKETHSFSDDDWGRVFASFKAHLQDYIHITKPQAVIFSGGLSAKHHSFIDSLKLAHDTPVQSSVFGDHGGLMGGFGLFKIQPNS